MTTRAAEGPWRRRWSVAEIEAMVSAGIVAENERFELLEGEVVPMSPKGIRHELVKTALTRYWFRRLPAEIGLSQETTFHIDEDTFVEPRHSDDGKVTDPPARRHRAIDASASSLHAGRACQ